MLSAPPPSDPGLSVAFEEALAGYHEGGLPIGASLFYRGELIGRQSDPARRDVLLSERRPSTLLGVS